jgi:hypothetical protein
MTDKEKQQAIRIAQMLDPFIRNCSEVIVETGDMSFDIAFVVGGVRYRMTMAQEPDEKTAYLKQN